MTFRFQSQGNRQRVRVLLEILVLLAIAAPAFSAEPQDRTYALSLAPSEIYERLSELKMGPVPAISERERELLGRIWKLKSTQPATPVKVETAVALDAMLFASGIEDGDAHRKYGEQFDRLLVAARNAAKKAKDNRQRGEALMKFLHVGVMSKGYEENQTSLAAVFDTGNFNCCSAAAMYYLVGSSLGLELQPISIPGSQFLAGHASLDLVDGNERLQVEPTNPDGFDWETKKNRPGVIVIGFTPDRKDGHDVDALGVASMIYSNRGVALMTGGHARRLEAATCYLAALSLDPLDESATNNLLSVFINWGPELATEKKFEEALRVLAFALQIAPQSESLQNNQRFVWNKYIDALLEAGDDSQALTAIQRAAEATKDESFQNASLAFVRYGETQLKESWDNALVVAERGVKVLPEVEGKKLLEWRSQVFRRWSQSLLDHEDAPDVAGSIGVLRRGYALDRDDTEILAGLAFHTQEALQKLEGKFGPQAAIAHYQALCKEFPAVSDISDAGRTHAGKTIEKLMDEKKFQQALLALDQYQPFLATPEQRAELAGIVYSGWARDLAENEQWEAALVKCSEALKSFPQQERIMNCIRVCVDEWAAKAMDAKNWKEAIRIYTVGLKYLPRDAHLEHNKQYCEQMK